MVVSPHERVIIMPKLNAANTRACARLNAGKALDTSASHSDTGPGQDMHYSSRDGFVALSILAGSHALSFFCYRSTHARPLILGHGHPAVIAAVREQLDHGHMYGA